MIVMVIVIIIVMIIMIVIIVMVTNLDGHHKTILQMGMQMFRNRLGVPLHPKRILGIQTDGDLTVCLQITHIDGPVYKLIGHKVQRFFMIVISRDQVGAVLIDTGKTYDRILLIHVDPDLRIDLHINRCVGLVAGG